MAHGPWKKQPDFGGKSDLDPELRNVWRNFSVAVGNGKGSSSWDWEQSENTQASWPQIEQIKGYLGGGLCYLSASILIDLHR